MSPPIARIFQAFLIVVFLTALFSSSAGSDDDVQITLTVVAANAEDAPLRVIGFKLPQTVGHPLKVVYSNRSKKPTTRFWIEALVGNPDERANPAEANNPRVRGIMSNVNWRWPEERVIPPESEGEARERGVGPYPLVIATKSILSNCLHVAAFVQRVEFADGTVWKLDSTEQTVRIWKDSLGGVKVPCRHRPEMEETLRQLQGAGYVTPIDQPTNASQGLVTSYSVTCTVRRVKGKRFAMCPF